MNDLKPVDADWLVKCYGNLVRVMARKIILNSNVVDRSDLEQVGMMALIAAASSHNASTGVSFGTYIRTCIRNALIAEANKCCGVFTIDPKVRLQVNQIIKLRDKGLDDEAIRVRLGMRTQRFLTLVALVDTQTIGVDDVVVDDRHYYDVESVISALNEIGLEDQEITLVELIITKHSAEKIQQILDVTKTGFRHMCQRIREKITSFGERYD